MIPFHPGVILWHTGIPQAIAIGSAGYHNNQYRLMYFSWLYNNEQQRCQLAGNVLVSGHLLVQSFAMFIYFQPVLSHFTRIPAFTGFFSTVRILQWNLKLASLEQVGLTETPYISKSRSQDVMIDIFACASTAPHGASCHVLLISVASTRWCHLRGLLHDWNWEIWSTSFEKAVD